MTIKIDGNRQTAETEATRRTDTSRKADSGPASTAAGKADRVEMSTDAKLMSGALKAAHDAPSIRQDAVERARKALDAGQIGQDSRALADKLIDDLING
jgi:flagellar biosynthesis anti-sigma factor FlgM